MWGFSRSVIISGHASTCISTLRLATDDPAQTSDNQRSNWLRGLGSWVECTCMTRVERHHKGTEVH
eukprot:scaffold9104_cov100-Isochrysis_galbana.AAC.4